VQDCLELLNNLLRGNQANQLMFRCVDWVRFHDAAPLLIAFMVFARHGMHMMETHASPHFPTFSPLYPFCREMGFLQQMPALLQVSLWGSVSPPPLPFDTHSLSMHSVL
jgi:hypothetical protein